MIGLLKSLGSGNGLIQKVFLYHGALITFGGLILGNIAALLVCWPLEVRGHAAGAQGSEGPNRTHFIGRKHGPDPGPTGSTPLFGGSRAGARRVEFAGPRGRAIVPRRSGQGGSDVSPTDNVPTSHEIRRILVAAADVIFSDGVSDAFLDQWADETRIMLSIDASAADTAGDLRRR